MSSVLVVDDEPAIVRTMAVNLRARGYGVQLASTGQQALELAARHHPDAVVLDLGLPDMEGLQVIHGLRGWTSVPIIVLSARSAESAKVAALDAGASDYITKPFGMDEFMARLRVALRSSNPLSPPPTIVTDDFRIDLARHLVTRNDGVPVHLTATEWAIVEVLARNAGKLVTQRQFLEEVWHLHGNRTNYLRVFMVGVRRKLEPNPSRPKYFITEQGCGLRFIPEGRPDRD
jgi:two-component system KDP operon response regulator KdpE